MCSTVLSLFAAPEYHERVVNTDAFEFKLEREVFSGSFGFCIGENLP
jgi:hypothetical protein